MLSTKTIVIAGAGIATAAGLALLGASFAGADQVSATTAGYGYGRGAAPGGEGGKAGEGATNNGDTDPSKPMRSDEQLLTGETADKVTAAAKAKEPDATVERVETDSDGVYEAHMLLADGTHITVQVGADFQVTNLIEGGEGKGGPAPAGGAPNGVRPPASGSTASS